MRRVAGCVGLGKLGTGVLRPYKVPHNALIAGKEPGGIRWGWLMMPG
ncbi:MAG: hypothetical protein ABSH13_02870 [Candidatus Acidiferrum sp.]|jgi:hypothetical protein